jgi:hypothetical protein
LKHLEHIEDIVQQNQLPASMPETVDADVVYDAMEDIRSRQTKAAREKAGPVLRARVGLPEGCSAIALAINSEYQSKGCVVYNDGGQIDGIATYLKYHELKVPDVCEEDLAWFSDEPLLFNDNSIDHGMCSCPKKKRKILGSECPSPYL